MVSVYVRVWVFVRCGVYQWPNVCVWPLVKNYAFVSDKPARQARVLAHSSKKTQTANIAFGYKIILVIFYGLYEDLGPSAYLVRLILYVISWHVLMRALL